MYSLIVLDETANIGRWVWLLFNLIVIGVRAHPIGFVSCVLDSPFSLCETLYELA